MAQEKVTIKMTVTVEVNVQDWCNEYGVTPGQVRKDVESYINVQLDYISPLIENHTNR